MICAKQQGAEASMRLEGSSLDTQSALPTQGIELQVLPDVVAASMPQGSNAAKSAETCQKQNPKSRTGGEFSVIRAAENGNSSCQSDCGTAPSVNVTNAPARCCHCHRKLNESNSAKQADSLGPCDKVDATSTYSLPALERHRESDRAFARRSTSLPGTVNRNNNHGDPAGGKYAAREYYTTTHTYAVGRDCEMSDYEDDEGEEEKLSTRTKALAAVVVLLTIITISTVSALVYFVVFGNRSVSVTTVVLSSPVIVSTTVEVPDVVVNTTVTTTTHTITVPETNTQLNQTLYCGIFPAKYLPPSTVNLRSYVPTNTLSSNPMRPVNDSRLRVSSRIVGGEPTNIRLYPWQRQNYPVEATNANRAQPRVMGGTDAIVPWQVSLWVKDKGVTCGGSIILDNWILTAAHCTQSKLDVNLWTVYAGTSALSKRNEPPAVMRKVTKIIQHELYPEDMSYDYDVSLMKLDRSLTFVEEIQPICVPPQGYQFPAGKSCYVSGWGAVDPYGLSSHPDVLQHAQVDIIADATCNGTDWLEGLITSRMLCAGKPQGMRDACQGDSGGPLSCYSAEEGVWTLAGCVSWGVECGLPQMPGVYARMGFFTDWIWNNIGKAEGWIPET